MRNYLENQKINQFKNDYEFLINYFLKFTVQFGFKFGLVDFKILSIDSTPIEAYVNEFRSLSMAVLFLCWDLMLSHPFKYTSFIPPNPF